MHHYQHHIGDFAKDTMGLSQGEVGAYRLLMDAAYATENGIASDEVYAIAKAFTKAERVNADRVISKHFTLRDGRYYQGRIESELAIYREKSEKAAASARRRWDGNANAMRTHSDGNADGGANRMLTINQEPITKEKHTRVARATPLPDGFVVSDRVLKWAAQRSLSGVIDLHLEAFVSTCRAKGYTYVDWDEAFMNAVRKNWAKIDGPRVDAATGRKRPAI